MYTYDVKPCTDRDTCPSDCEVAYFGIENQPTIGLHLYGYRAAVATSAPVDLEELKYHLGFWFSKHSNDVATSLFWSMHGTPAGNCSAACNHRDCSSFVYGTELPPGGDYLREHQRKVVEAVTLQAKKSGKKGKNHKFKASTLTVVAGMCMDCYMEKAITIRGELEAANNAIEPTPTPGTDASTSGSPPTPAALISGRPQTCFCDECLNPPERYARLDDSDLEE